MRVVMQLVMRAVAWPLRFGGTQFLFGIALGCLAQACTGDDGAGSERCREMCESGCEAFAECNLGGGSESCADDCTKTLGASDCSDAVPLDQLTCDELKREVDCASYCVAICHRAPECASFDEPLCLAGCGAEHVSICNPASVDARTCDQMKPEMRLYEEAGRALHDGDGFGASFGFGPQYGLCKNADDCEPPLSCSAETNTCGDCTTDAECDDGTLSQAHMCDQGACVEVECTNDDHCFGGFCDLAAHVCGDCRDSSECSSSGAPACDVSTFTCVQCVEDSDCTGGTAFGPLCNTARHSCVECVTNADCTSPNRSKCDPSLGYCMSCDIDEDCPAGKICNVGSCE